MSVDKERRMGPRVPHRSLVEIAAGDDGCAAFEAESVDVNTSGMRLATAYLPEIGEPVACRFDGPGGDVMTQGQVIWRVEDSYGGEFGVKFLEVDKASFGLLKDLTGEDERAIEEDEPSSEDESSTTNDSLQRGARVRLHLDGLGSPMKARVREAGRSELVVGSNLEFLRIGREAMLKVAEGESERPVRIERIAVEVEPSQLIPQLIVTLRCLDIADAQETSEMAAGTRVTHPSGTHPHTRKDTRSARSSVSLEDRHEAEVRAWKSGPAVWDKVKELGPVFSTAGTVAARWGTRATEVVGKAVSGAGKLAADKVKEHRESGRPRRTTAPPPRGALRGDGSRETRQTPIPPDAYETAPTGRRRMLVAGAAATIALIVGLSAARGMFTTNDEAKDSSAKAASSGSSALLMAAAPAANSPELVANVPLFGATPMTTVVPMVPAAAQPVMAVPAVIPNVNGEDDTDDGAMAAAEDSSEAQGGDEEEGGAIAANSAEEGDDEESEGQGSAPAVTSFGKGTVKNPKVLSIRMSQKIKSLQGQSSSDGFTVKVVGARSKEPAAGLRRQDKRISEARLSNQGKNAELTIRFGEEAPAGYRVVAKGSTLRIMLDGGKKTAQAAPKKPGKKKSH